MTSNRRVGRAARAQLRDPAGFSPPIYRLPPSPELSGLVRGYWVPVWSLPEGVISAQRVLPYPVCHLVIASSYDWLVGPASGLSVRELSGSGWAFGTMLQPATGWILLGRPVTELTDTFIPLDRLVGVPGAALVDRVREVVGADPADRARQRAAIGLVEGALAHLVPIDQEGLLVNAIVKYVEGDPRVQRVGQVCAEFDLTERSLQRVTARRIGLSPKWLIQRRRLHEAAERLACGVAVDLAGIAAEIGYADQAHFTRDFRRVTGLTPGRYAAEPRPG